MTLFVPEVNSLLQSEIELFKKTNGVIINTVQGMFCLSGSFLRFVINFLVKNVYQMYVIAIHEELSMVNCQSVDKSVNQLTRMSINRQGCQSIYKDVSQE